MARRARGGASSASPPRAKQRASTRRSIILKDTTMKTRSANAAVTKMLTGIQGFDEITDGGLPRGRTTLVMGGPGCGKTVFALQALVNGAHGTKEAGAFVAFEESTRQIVANAATFGWDLPALVKKKLFFLNARLDPD